MEQRLALITLGVTDFKKSAKFYLDGLGWKATEDSSNHIIFIQMNGFLLSLYPHSELAADATVNEDRSNLRGFTLAYNVSTPAQVDRVLDFAVQAGAKLTKPAQKATWGGSVIFQTPMVFFGKLPVALLWIPK